MIVLLDKSSLYNTFGVDSFGSLEGAINNTAPSMVDYYLSSLTDSSNDIYLNKTQIENSIDIGDYKIYKDYNDNLYLELYNNEENYETKGFW